MDEHRENHVNEQQVFESRKTDVETQNFQIVFLSLFGNRQFFSMIQQNLESSQLYEAMVKWDLPESTVLVNLHCHPLTEPVLAPAGAKVLVRL